ncbi:hypothetical protein [Halobellus litoreus]|uniref:Uncharacterized protein n=1 Tax=Halobellus litoreus TaxID=755310 RepID=A0ABD6DYH0_9EURY|nr:hypothetical protein [Halobellus litoreus]
MALDCPVCGIEHEQGDAFAENVIGNAASFTYFVRCSECGTLFDDTGKKYNSEGDLPEKVRRKL